MFHEVKIKVARFLLRHCCTCDHKVVGSIPCQVAIKWSVTVCLQVNHLSVYNQYQGQLSLLSLSG